MTDPMLEIRLPEMKGDRPISVNGPRPSPEVWFDGKRVGWIRGVRLDTSIDEAVTAEITAYVSVGHLVAEPAS